MGNRRRIFLVGFLVAFLALLSILAVAQEKLKFLQVLRPDLVAVADPCVLVAQEGSYTVNKGSLIEIDWRGARTPGCGPDTVVCGVSNSGVLKEERKLSGWAITNGPSGVLEGATFFRAKRAGYDTITLTLDGVSYTYQIEVR